MPTRIAVITERWAEVPGNLRGATWMAISTLAFVSGQVLIKRLTPDIPVVEVTFFRSLITLLIALPVVINGGAAAFRTARLPLHVVRGIVGALAMLGMFYGVSKLPLATVNTINFARPLFMILLAVLFLGEVVRIHRWVATVIGFVGVLLVMRPGVESFDPAALAVLGSAACYAIAQMQLKLLTRTEHPAAIIFYYMLVAALVVLVPTLFAWVPPSTEQWLMLLGVGISSALAQTFLTIAYRAGDATVVSPFDYTRILWACGFDIVLFALFPDTWTLAGTAIIVAATLYIGRRSATVEAGGSTPGKG